MAEPELKIDVVRAAFFKPHLASIEKTYPKTDSKTDEKITRKEPDESKCEHA